MMYPEDGILLRRVLQGKVPIRLAKPKWSDKMRTLLSRILYEIGDWAYHAGHWWLYQKSMAMSVKFDPEFKVWADAQTDYK